MRVALVSIALACSVGCGGMTEGPSGTPDTAPSPGLDAGLDSGAGCAPTGSLSGTWDITGALAGDSPHPGLIVLDTDRLEVTFGSDSLSFLVAGGVTTLTWKKGTKVEPLSMSRSATPFEVGALPLGVGGHFTFGDPLIPTASCTADLSPESITAACAGTKAPKPIYDLNGRMQGTHHATAESIFGALGGDWRFGSGLDGPDGGKAVSASFRGNVVMLHATETRPTGVTDRGTITVTFCGSTASGSSDQGLEFSARKR